MRAMRVNCQITEVKQPRWMTIWDLCNFSFSVWLQLVGKFAIFSVQLEFQKNSNVQDHVTYPTISTCYMTHSRIPNLKPSRGRSIDL